MKMKLTPTRNSILQINILLLLAGVLGAQAQTTYFKENNATAINSSASWATTTGGTTPAGPPGPGDIGEWDSTVTAANTVAVGGPLTIGEILIANPGGAVSITDGTAANILTLNGVSGLGINNSAATQNLTIGAPLTLGGNQTWNIASGRTVALNGVNALVMNTSVLTVKGGGTLNVNFSSDETGRVAASTAGAGVVLNNSFLGMALVSNTAEANANPFFGGNVTLTLTGNNTMTITGTATTGNHTQTFSTLTMNPGSDIMTYGTRGSSSGVSISFTAVSRNAGSMVDVTIRSGASTFGNSIQCYGFPGSTVLGYATSSQGDWVLAAGATTATTTNGNFAANTFTTSTADVTVTANDTPATFTINSLRFVAAGPLTLTLSGVNTINSGGILANSTVGASTATITGGTLTSANIAALATGNAATNANGVADLIVINNNSTAGSSVVVNSVIADNGAYPVGLTAGSTLGTAPSGPIQLGGANTFSGPTYITKGILQLNNALALQDSALNYSLPGTLSFGTLTAATLGGLSGANGLVLTNSAGAAVALSVGNNNSTNTYSGVMSGSGSLTKIGPGTLILAGTNTYTGVTTVSGGTLGGSGSIAGIVTNQAGGNIAPGAGVSAPGTVLTLNSNLTLSAGSALTFNVSTNLGTNDQIVVNGALTLNSAVFHLKAPSASLNLGFGTYVLITNASSITVVGSPSLVWDAPPANPGQYALAVSGNAVSLQYVTGAGPIIYGVGANPNPAYPNETVLISTTVVTNGHPIASITADVSQLAGTGLPGSGITTVPLVLSATPNVYTNSVVIGAGVSIGSVTNIVIAVDNATPTANTTYATNTLSIIYGAPTITASASPNPVGLNQTITITATVTAQSYPVNPNSVTVDVSAIAGVPNTIITLYLSSVANVYTNSYTVANTTSYGPQTLTVYAADNQSELGSGTINLTVSEIDVWTGLGGDNNWSTGRNWFSGVPPSSSGAPVIFSGTTQLTSDMNSSYSLTSLTFNPTAGSFDITDPSSTLTLTGSVTNNSTSSELVDVPVVLGAAVTLNAASGNLVLDQNIDNGGHLLTLINSSGTTNILSGVVSDTGGLTQNGPGMTVLSGNDTYSGTTTVNNGALFISGNNTGGAVTVNTGTLTISDNNNTVSGVVTVSSGALNIAAGTTTDSDNVNGNVIIGNSTNLATLSISSGADFENNAGTTVRLYMGNVANSVAVINNAGILDMNNDGPSLIAKSTGASAAIYNTGTFTFGAGAVNTDFGDGAGAYGYFYNNGTFSAAGSSGVQFGWGGNGAANYGAGASSVLDVAGGTFTVANALHNGTILATNANGGLSLNYGNGGTNQETSQINVTAGGTLTVGSVTNGPVAVNGFPNAYASINVSGAGSLFSTPVGGGIYLNGVNNANDIATLSLANGGALDTSYITNAGTTSSQVFSLNGGTLAATASGTLISGGVTTYIEAGGVNTIDNGGFIATIASALQTPSGSGVTGIALGGTLTGYIGAPVVVISGGGGTGAAAIAAFNPATGTITGVTITSPGSGYTNAPTVALIGGSGASGVGARAGTATATATIGPVGSGGVTFTSAGTNILAAVNTYTGNTIINSGTLQLASGGSINNSSNIVVAAGGTLDVSALASPVLVANQSLSGLGTVNTPLGGALGASSGSIIAPSMEGATQVGTLTFSSGGLALAGGAKVGFYLSDTYNGVNDQISIGGALTVSNNYIHIKAPSSSDSLDASGNDYVLMAASSISGSLLNTMPVWDVAPLNAAHYQLVKSGNSINLHYSVNIPPTASGYATPSTNALRNGTVLITVTVTNGSSPTISSVTVDGTSLGQSVVTLKRVGATAVWTNSVMVPVTTALGVVTLPVATTDGNNLTGAFAITFTVVPSTETWDGLGSAGNWSTNQNWVSGSAPGYVGDSLVFAGLTRLSPNMDTNYSIASLTFDVTAGAFTIMNAANTLTLTGSVTNNSANVETLGVPVVLSGTETINAASGNLVMNTNVSGVGGVIAAGTNTVTLAGSNTYSGPTMVISNAILQLANSNAVSGSALTLNSGSTLQLRGDANTTFAPASLALQNAPDTLNFDASPLTSAAGHTLALSGALASASSADQTINVTGNSTYTLSLGAINLRADTAHTPFASLNINTLSSGPAVTISSITVGNWGNSLNMNGGGKVTVTGNLGNTSNGSLELFVNNGTTVTLQGVSVKANTGDAFKYDVANGTLVLDNSYALTNYPGGTGLGQGLFVLGAATNIFYGTGYTLEAGVLTATNNSYNAAVYLGDANNLTGGLTIPANLTNNVSDGDVTFTNTGTMTIGGQNTSGTNTYANPIILGWTANKGKSVTLVAATGGEVDFTGGIRANGTDTTAGITVGDATHGGIVRIRGTANTYAGTTMVSNGTLIVSGTVGNGAVAVAGGTMQVSGTAGNGPVTVSNGTLLVSGTIGTGAVTVGNGGTLSGGGTIGGAAAIQTGGSVVPGQGASAAGTVLTIANGLTLSTGSTTTLAVSHNIHTNDQITCVAIVYGGTLNVTTVAGDAPLASGDTFQLFKANSSAFYSGSFSATNLPALSPGLVWSNSLGAGGNGTITVTGTVVSGAPVTISGGAITGGMFVISGTNGAPGAQYRILETTNAALAITNWTPVWTNVFGAGGSFSYTNTPGVNPAGFFLLVSP
jgi:fibronectin-binding autotransporter adhesin